MPSLDLARRAQWTVVVATAIAVGAMLRYPGGTPLDATTLGYSFAHNFLSDLGMTVAYNHEPNRVGATLFAVSLLLLVIGLGSVVVVIARFLAVDAASRRWARLSAVALLAVCVSFAGVAVTPENRSDAAACQLHDLGLASRPRSLPLPWVRDAPQRSAASAHRSRLVRRGDLARGICGAHELGAECCSG